MLSNTVQNAIIGDDNTVTGGVIGALSLLAINYVVVRFLFRRAKLDRFLEGAPLVLIEDGHVKKKSLDHELITLTELKAAAHKQGFRSLDDVEQCVLETGGSISFVAKDPAPMANSVRGSGAAARRDQPADRGAPAAACGRPVIGRQCPIVSTVKL